MGKRPSSSENALPLAHYLYNLFICVFQAFFPHCLALRVPVKYILELPKPGSSFLPIGCYYTTINPIDNNQYKATVASLNGLLLGHLL